MHAILLTNLVLFIICLLIGRMTRRVHAWRVLYLLAFIVAFFNAAYYLHAWDNCPIYYRIRSSWVIDHSPALAGLLIGHVCSVHFKGMVLTVGLGFVAAMGMATPCAKVLINPLDHQAMSDRRTGDVILQSSTGTCGPCSLANILLRHGVRVTEAELAREAYASASGTESWYLQRCAERRGFLATFRFDAKEVEADSIIGITLPGGAGHFLAVLAVDGERVQVVDSLTGRRTIQRSALFDTYRYSGLHLKLDRMP